MAMGRWQQRRAVSNDDGDTWTLIERVTNIPPGWVEREVRLNEHIAPLTEQMRFRFSVMDNPNNSKDEGGLDAVIVSDISCVAPASGDFDGDGDVDLGDHAVFVDCLAGPDANPNPALQDVTTQGCLTAFDFTSDNDVDLEDFAGFTEVFTGE